MFCRTCGKESGGAKKFCTNCGTAFLELKKVQDSNIQQKSSWSAKKVLKVAGVLCVIGVIVYSNIQDSAENSAVDLNNAAVSAFNLGHKNQVIDEFQKASEAASTSETKVITLINLAYAYSAQENETLALTTFKQAQKESSIDSADYYLIAGEIAELEGKPNAAFIAYTKAYEKDPSDYQINNSLALFHLDLYDVHPQYSDYDKALKYAQKANQLSDNNVSKKNLALAYYFSENYSQTISILTSIDLSASPIYYYYLGLAYIGKDDVLNAKLYFRRAVTGGIELPQDVKDYLDSN